MSSVPHSPYVAHSDSVTGSYPPSAFIGQPVKIDQVGSIWIGKRGATSHMTRSPDLMYDTRPLPTHRSGIILGDGSIKKVQFTGKIYLALNSRINFVRW